MWKTLALILPVLVPSWRFFKTIEPSPRVQWAFVTGSDDALAQWQEFRPRPTHVSILQMLRRLFWNPAWNETLFLVSCAERIQDQPTDHSINEIRHRIAREITQQPTEVKGETFHFRLVFMRREADKLLSETVFLSKEFPLKSGGGL